MFTICPKCALTLDVTAGDLRLGQGYVRCGRCSSVFNALASLRDEPSGEGGGLESPAAPEEIPDSALEFDPSRSDLSKLFVGSSGEIEQIGSGTFETIVLQGDDGEPPWTSGETPAEEAMEQELRDLVSRLDRDLIGLDPDPAAPPVPARAPDPARPPDSARPPEFARTAESARPPDSARTPDSARGSKPATTIATAESPVPRAAVMAPPPPSRRSPPLAATPSAPRLPTTSPPTAISPSGSARAPTSGAASVTSASSKRLGATHPVDVAAAKLAAPTAPAAPTRRPTGPQLADAGANRLPPGRSDARVTSTGSTQAPAKPPSAMPGDANQSLGTPATAISRPGSPAGPSATAIPASVVNRAPLARPLTPRPPNVRAPAPPSRPATPSADQPAAARSAAPTTSPSTPAPAAPPAPHPTASRPPTPPSTAGAASASASASASAPISAPVPTSAAPATSMPAPHSVSAPQAASTISPPDGEDEVEPFEIAPAVAAAVAAAAAARRRPLAPPRTGPAAASSATAAASAASAAAAVVAQAPSSPPEGGAAETAAPDFLLNLELDSPIPPAPRLPAPVTAAISAALGLLLLAQIIHHYRGDLVAHGWFAGPLTDLYAKLGAPITPNWDVDAYEIRQLGAAAAATPGGSLVIRASVKNGAPRAQPVPVIELTLQDRYGNRLGSRALEPREYLAPGSARTTLAAGERVDTEIAVADPGQSAVGFEIDTCLHRSNGTLRCAAADHRSP